MSKVRFLLFVAVSLSIVGLEFLITDAMLWAADKDTPQGPPPVPVRVAAVAQKMVAEQVSLVGTTEAMAASTVAAVSSGMM